VTKIANETVARFSSVKTGPPAKLEESLKLGAVDSSPTKIHPVRSEEAGAGDAIYQQFLLRELLDTLAAGN